MQPRLRASLFDRVFLGLEYAICLTFFGLCIIFKRSVYQLRHECLGILPTRLMKSLKRFLQCWHLGRFNRQVFHLQEKHNSFNSKFPCQTTSLILSQHDLQNLSSKAGQNEIVNAFISSTWRTSSGQKSTNLNYQRLRGGDPGGVFNKILFGETPPRGPTPYPCTGLEVNFLAHLQSFASKNCLHKPTGQTTSKFFPFVWETWMILTRKRLLMDIFLTRRLSISFAFSEFASVIFEPRCIYHF